MTTETQSIGLLRYREGRPDPVLFLLLFLLTGFGLFVLLGISSGTKNAYRFFYQQLISFVIGLPLFFIGLEVSLDWLRKRSLLVVLGALILMGLVFVPGIGLARASSAHIPRWIGVNLPGIGSFTFQPVEFAKIALVLYLAHKLQNRPDNSLKSYIGPLLPVAALVLLTVLQPNYGSALVLVLITTVIVFASGIRVTSIIATGIILVPVAFVGLILRSYRSDRILVWLNPYDYPGKAFQILEAFKGFYEGSFLGRTIGTGRAHRVLPDRHNDFVFAMVANDYGLIGIGLLILCYFFIMVRSLSILRKLGDPFHKLLGFGIVSLILLQAILNMAVVTGLIPTTGISLPFVSLGGSNLIILMFAAGLLLNVSSQEFARDKR